MQGKALIDLLEELIARCERLKELAGKNLEVSGIIPELLKAISCNTQLL